MELQKEKLIELLTQIAPNNYVQALINIIVFLCFTNFFYVLISNVLLKLIENTKMALEDKIIDIVHKPIFFTIMILGLGLAAERLEFQ